MSRRKKIKWWNSEKRKIYIFSEWETEICYFNQIKWSKIGSNIIWEVFSKPSKQLSSINKKKLIEKRKSLYTKIKDIDDFWKRDLKKIDYRIYYLLDSDVYSNEEINFIKASFEEENIKTFFSNKDFELWILLHFNDYQKEDWKYIEKIEEMTKKKYKKWNCNIDFFKELIENNLKKAIKRWKDLEKYQIKSQWRHEIKFMNPYTEVYKIFKEI